MEIKLITSYKKRVDMRDSNGNLVLDSQNQPMKEITTRFRYGIVKASPKELEMFKEMQQQEGTDYYQEEHGVPVYNSARFLGVNASLNIWFNETTAKYGASVDETEIDILKEVAKATPTLAANMEAQISSKLLQGTRLVFKNEFDDAAFEESKDQDANKKPEKKEEGVEAGNDASGLLDGDQGKNQGKDKGEKK